MLVRLVLNSRIQVILLQVARTTDAYHVPSEVSAFEGTAHLSFAGWVGML